MCSISTVFYSLLSFISSLADFTIKENRLYE